MVAEMYNPKPINTDNIKLPESEREYDRATAFATIKMIVALGYKIEKL